MFIKSNRPNRIVAGWLMNDDEGDVRTYSGLCSRSHSLCTGLVKTVTYTYFNIIINFIVPLFYLVKHAPGQMIGIGWTTRCDATTTPLATIHPSSNIVFVSLVNLGLWFFIFTKYLLIRLVLGYTWTLSIYRQCLSRNPKWPTHNCCGFAYFYFLGRGLGVNQQKPQNKFNCDKWDRLSNLIIRWRGMNDVCPATYTIAEWWLESMWSLITVRLIEYFILIKYNV